MSQPEDDPRDEVQTWPCRKCEGNGRVFVRRHDTAVVVTEACPRCHGSCTDPDPLDLDLDEEPPPLRPMTCHPDLTHHCRCPHEDCGGAFTHHGTLQETTCCPHCGRQQMPQPEALA